jgi:branched-chain amino acid transport system permease protein
MDENQRAELFGLGPEWMKFRVRQLLVVDAAANQCAAKSELLDAMVVFGLAFNAVVLRRLTAGPVISVVMVTLGLGAVMRGLFPLMFHGIPAGVHLPNPPEPLHICRVIVSREKLAAAAVALTAIVVVTLLYSRTRTGIALRAIADDRQAALAVGINVDRHFGIVWAMAGIVSVCAGVL